jgi:hypothetical protein
MVRQAAVVVQPTKVRSADVAHLKFLVSRGTGCILEVLELPLACLLLVLCGADLVEFVQGLRDGACFAEYGDFEKTGVDGLR